MKPLQLQLQIYGRVQGVFLRATIKQWANELSLAGFVKNEPNGSVTVIAQGSKYKLEQLLARCYDTSNEADNYSSLRHYAHIDDIKVSWKNITDKYHTFTIRY